MLITKLIHIDLLKYLIQVVAVDVLKEPDKYVNSVDKHTGRLLSILSETVFPFDEANYKHDEFSALKEEYKRYIEYVKRVEAEQEANNNA